MTSSPFDRGIFTISLDLELVWGMLDLVGPTHYKALYRVEREQVIDRLLALFVEFDIAATWCILGHLFLDRCSADSEGRKHPEIVRPQHSWHPHDWFVHDPCSNERADPIFYGRALIEKIRNCRVHQEIGSHSFSHLIFGDSGCSAEAALSDLNACQRLASELNIPMTSFVFPRNEIGHLEAVKAAGFKAYRGVEPHWFEQRSVPAPIRRAARLAQVLTAAAPPVVLPDRDSFGLWNIPGSAMYFPMHGRRRHIPIGRRIRRTIKGLNAAARQRKVFHLWFHPTNLADEMDTMFSGLRSILEHATDLRSADKLSVRTMRDLVGEAEASEAR